MLLVFVAGHFAKVSQIVCTGHRQTGNDIPDAEYQDFTTRGCCTISCRNQTESRNFSDQVKEQELMGQLQLLEVWHMVEGSPTSFWLNGFSLFLTTSCERPLRIIIHCHSVMLIRSTQRREGIYGYYRHWGLQCIFSVVPWTQWITI